MGIRRHAFKPMHRLQRSAMPVRRDQENSWLESRAYRANPLKSKAFGKKIDALLSLGLDEEIAKELSAVFNSRFNDPRQALYVLDWWKARLSLIKLLETNNDKYFTFLSQYFNRYGIRDYSDLALDDELQLDHYASMKHYAHMAATHPVFRQPWPYLPPSELLPHLKEQEKEMETNRFFKPEDHSPLISFGNGLDWVVVSHFDARKEASSLRDCAECENKQSVLLSLRQPVGGGFYKTLLHAEVAFPKRWAGPRLYQEGYNIVNHPGVLVQLRGMANSKPKDKMHPYITELLLQSWVTFVIRPKYQAYSTFILDDLDVASQSALQRKKPFMFDIKLYMQQMDTSRYPKVIQESIYDTLDLSVKQAISALTGEAWATRVMQERALRVVTHHLRESSDSYHRGKIFKALSIWLMTASERTIITAVETHSLQLFKQFNDVVYRLLLNRVEYISLKPRLFSKLLVRLTWEPFYSRRHHSLKRYSPQSKMNRYYAVLRRYVEHGAYELVLNALLGRYFGSDINHKGLTAVLRILLSQPLSEVVSLSLDEVLEEQRGWGNTGERKLGRIVHAPNSLTNVLLRGVQSEDSMVTAISCLFLQAVVFERESELGRRAIYVVSRRVGRGNYGRATGKLLTKTLDHLIDEVISGYY